jgi:hypothetical protein
MQRKIVVVIFKPLIGIFIVALRLQCIKISKL